MNKLHNKPFRFLIIGICIGILLGGAFVYIWQQQLSINIFKSSLDKIYTSIEGNSDAKDTVEVKDINPNQPLSNNSGSHHAKLLKDTASDTDSDDGLPDRDTILPTTEIIGDGDVVVRDQLLFTRNIKIENYIPKVPDKVDSLLSENQEIVKKEKIIKVEFWKSPINYTGYKFANDKLVLFGVFEPSAVNIDYQNDNYILIYKDVKYPLQVTLNFINLKFKTPARQ